MLEASIEVDVVLQATLDKLDHIVEIIELIFAVDEIVDKYSMKDSIEIIVSVQIY